MAQDDQVDVPTGKRLFISGIAQTLSKDELVTRLKTYGTVTSDLELNLKNADTTGIFGHCEITLTANQWARLRKLSGMVLKGRKLRIEEARQDWIAKRTEDEQRPEPKVPNPRKRPPPDTIPAIESRKVKRGALVKDSQITQKSRSKGWIKGRYGRALAVLKRDGQPPLKRNPEALSRLWGVAHPAPDQLTAWYDEEEEEWHDRRGRVIKETEITRKARTIETRQSGRVEVWDSDNDEENPVQHDQPEYTTASSTTRDYLPSAPDEAPTQMSEEQIAAQLAVERSSAIGLINDMFKDVEDAEVAAVAKQEKRRARDKLDIVKRFDPSAPEAETDDESESEPEPEPELDPDQSNDVDPLRSSAVERAADDSEIKEVDDESEPVPSFLRPRTDHVNTEDLTTIFKPSSLDDAVPFNLFEPDEFSEEEEVMEEMPDVVADHDTHQDIHPDRLNLAQTADAPEDEYVEGNANYTALAKDRGYSLSTFSSTASGTFPLLLSTGPGSVWYGQASFFGASINAEDVKRRWEESRADVTRDWKRKRREGTKKMRKATARQGR